MSHLSRRQFVTAAAALVAAPAFAVAGTSWSFRATTRRRMIGWLTTTDPDTHEAALKALRAATGYTRRLTYASTDRLKLPYAMAAIGHLARAEDLAFATEWVTVAPRNKPHGAYPELEQLAGFLTGCSYGATIGTKHPVKRALIDALREQTSLIA
jgi:hypothetical protein